MAIDLEERTRERSMQIARKFPPEYDSRIPIKPVLSADKVVLGPAIQIPLNGASPQTAYGKPAGYQNP